MGNTKMMKNKTTNFIWPVTTLHLWKYGYSVAYGAHLGYSYYIILMQKYKTAIYKNNSKCSPVETLASIVHIVLSCQCSHFVTRLKVTVLELAGISSASGQTRFVF